MSYYYRLQYIRLLRWLDEKGIDAILALISSVAVFIFFSLILWTRTEYARWIYLIIVSSLLNNLAGKNRNKILKGIFSAKEYIKLRVSENIFLIFPFLLFLLFKQEILAGALLVVISLLFTLVSPIWVGNKAIPTPFWKFPFEFIVGFRKSLWIIIIAYFLIFKAIQVSNYNLGIFGLFLLFLIGISFYQKPETEYFVWIYNHCPQLFIKSKILTAILCFSVLSCVALAGMLIGFSSQWSTTILVYVLGFIVFITMVLGKYAAYPDTMNILQGILYLLGIIFPPLMIMVIIVFYRKSKKRLESILVC